MEYALKSSWKCLSASLESGEESLPPAVAARCANLDQVRGWGTAGGAKARSHHPVLNSQKLDV